MATRPEDWMEIRKEGLYVHPADLFIDPILPVRRAVISHGHADHARAGHASVLTTPETLAIMRTRLGEESFGTGQELGFGETVTINGLRLSFLPAGHVLGSAQILMEYQGFRVLYSGDYKRSADPTCQGFQVVACDLFITEATFGLPVFRHPSAAHEIEKLLKNVSLFPERCHVIGAYALGKAQRMIALLRAAGWERPIHLHGALLGMCDLYRHHGVDLGELRAATAGSKGMARGELAGEIVLAPPSAIADRWARRLPDPLVCMASGWMQVKQRAKQRGVELPLVISDHADWDELLRTFHDVKASEIWVTHGREEALVHAARQMGLKAKALAMIGYEEDT